MSDPLPPLPRPWECGLCGSPPGYTVEHMRDYARAAVEAALAAAPACPHIRSSGPPERATNWCALGAAPQAEPVQEFASIPGTNVRVRLPVQEPAQEPVQEQRERELNEALTERDDAEDYIDALLDEVLGPDRAEWSSAYGRADALEEVRERIAQMLKPSIDKAWNRFEAALEQQAQPVQEPGFWGRAALEAALAAAPQAEPVAKVVQTAPASIWLQVSDDLEHEDEPFPRGSLASEVTWSEVSVMDVEVQYVRADLKTTPDALREAARMALREMERAAPLLELYPDDYGEAILALREALGDER